MRRALLAIVLVSCGSGEFRPAKGARVFPPTRDAYRVQQEPDGCDKVGSVDGESIEEVAELAAEHGGTHYVVRVDHVSRDGYDGAVIGQTISIRESRTRRVSATAYRCP